MYIQIGRGGKTTDQIIRYAVALYIKQHRPDAEIVNFENADWNISTRKVDLDNAAPVPFGREEFSNLDMFLTDRPDNILITWPILNIDLFKAVREPLLRQLSQLPRDNGGERALANDELLIHMRMGDIAKFVHRDYWPLPIQYYKQLCASRSLKPVFFGELFRHPDYFNQIKQIMPDARMMPPGSVMEDFLRIQSAKRIAVSISSYSWLSSWLSETAEEIHMPYCGLFSTVRRPDVQLIDMHDKRYHFHVLPNLDWKKTVDVLERNLTVGMTMAALTENVSVWEESGGRIGFADHVRLNLRRLGKHLRF